MASEAILVGIPEIASLAKVSRPAVSNWRKRYDDFPEPRVQSDSGVLFDLRSIEEWLLARGKIDQPIPSGALLWRFADALRGTWPAETLFEFTSSWLCYLEACARTADGDASRDGRAVGAHVAPKHRWLAVRQSTDAELAQRLRAAAEAIESANPQLVDLMTFLAPEPFPDPSLVRSFVAELEATADAATPRFTLFEDAQQRVAEVARSSAESTTPDAISYLATELIGKIDAGATVVDPACGTGGLLLMAGVADAAPESHARFVGVDVDQTAARYARARFFLYGLNAEITALDSLRRDPSDWPSADVVLCDPPYGLRNWGDAEVYRSPLWHYGSPPPSSADLAWVQLCLSILKPTGRGLVVLPPASCSRGGREAMIREALVRAGVIEAVIHMPPRLRRDTSIPLAIWLLRLPEAMDSGDRVLLVDASALGTPGRSTHDLSEEDIADLTAVVRRWRSDGVAEPTGELVALAVGADEIVAADADLTPRRYRPAAKATGTDVLRAQCQEALLLAGRGLEDLDETLDSLTEMTAPAQITAATRVRLGEVAEVFRARAGKGDRGHVQKAHAEDLLLETTTTGFAVRMLTEREVISGLHAIVIRVAEPGRLRPTWLWLWTQTEEFADLVDRYSKGATIRSLSVKDLVSFELEVPLLEVQIQSEGLLDRLNELAAIQASLVGALEVFRLVQLRLAYSDVTQ